MRWVTFFPGVHLEHLTKDVGLLPYYMSQNGFESTLLTTGSGLDDCEIPTEVRSLRLNTLPDEGKSFFLEKSFLNYLDEHAKAIDVLHLFHHNRDTIFYGLKYKKLNPNGFLYIKLDAYNQHLIRKKIFSKNPFKDFYMQIKARKLYKSVDLFTIENTAGKSMAEKTYPEWKSKLEYLPNGCNDVYLDSIDFNTSEKENVVLSVGRLGSADKNYDLFLRALEHIHLPGWKFRIIGPLSDEFSASMEKYKKQRPDLFENVEFTGVIRDREKLYREYSRARVFFLPSKFESFGIAFVEALYFGNVIVGHNGMAAFDDLSSKGKYGEYYEENNSESLAMSLERASENSMNKGIEEQIKAHTRQNFYWSSLARRLSSRIKNE